MNASKFHAVYGNLRARLVFFVIPLYRLNDQVTRCRDAWIHFMRWNYYLFFNQQTKSYGHYKTWSTWCLYVLLCASIFFVVVAFDSITKCCAVRSCAALSTENTMQSKGKMVSLMFFFLCFFHAYLILSFNFCYETRKETVRIFCWLDQHEQSTHSFEWLMTMEYWSGYSDHVGTTNESCFEFLYSPNLLDQLIDDGHSIMLISIQVLVRIHFISFLQLVPRKLVPVSPFQHEKAT